MNDIKFCFFIVSCAKNLEIVKLQVKTIKRFCKIPVRIYVSFDDKISFIEDNVVCLSGDYSDCFGLRVSKALEKVPYEHVIVMCDDFIVESEINFEELAALVETFYIDKKITAIALTDISGKNETVTLPYCKYGSKYIKRTRYSSYKTTFQCSLWDKAAFEKLIKKANNPWEFEVFTNQNTYLLENAFYALQKGEKGPVDYNRGCFIIRGKIVRPEKERLEKNLI